MVYSSSSPNALPKIIQQSPTSGTERIEEEEAANFSEAKENEISKLNVIYEIYVHFTLLLNQYFQR